MLNTPGASMSGNVSCFGDPDAITTGSSNATWLTQCDVYARIRPSCAAPTTCTPLTIWPSARLTFGSITASRADPLDLRTARSGLGLLVALAGAGEAVGAVPEDPARAHLVPLLLEVLERTFDVVVGPARHDAVE